MVSVLTNEERKIVDSLSNPKWDYRTIRGIAKETNIDEMTVTRILESRKDLVRESIVPSKNGERLFTLTKNVNTMRDVWAAFRRINQEKF